MQRAIETVLALISVLALLGLGLWYWNARHAVQLPVVSRVPEFSFTTEEGAPFTRADLQGRVSIVDFVFTTCGGTCPMMSTKMSELQTELRGDVRVQFVSVSVDPETDTPAVLAAYGKGYGAVPGKWFFLTGDKQAIFTLTRSGFHLGLDTEGLDAIIHSQKFVLVDANADIRGYYDSDDAMRRLIADARALAARGSR